MTNFGVSGNDVSREQECAEAVNGALHSTEFEYLGDSDYGRSDWWTRGEKPKQVRVEVQRSPLASFVIVKIEWRVSNGQRQVRSQKTCQIDCGATTTRRDREEASTRAVETCLMVYRDVLLATGVADPRHVADVPT